MAEPYPTLVQKKTLQSAPTVGAGTYTVTLDAPSAAGNLLVVVASSRHNVGAPTVTATGFTEIYNLGHLGGTGDV